MYNPYLGGMNVSNVNNMGSMNNMSGGMHNSPNIDFNSEDFGENIKVCVRIRPMNMMEQGRGDIKCVEYLNNTTILFKNKNITRNYTFGGAFGEGISQEELFFSCSLNVIIHVNK